MYSIRVFLYQFHSGQYSDDESDSGMISSGNEKSRYIRITLSDFSRFWLKGMHKISRNGFQSIFKWMMGEIRIS